MSLAQQPDDLKVTALNAAIRCLVAPLQLLGRVMGSEKNSTGHADDVATANGHNTPQSISLAIFLQITEVKASIRKAYNLEIQVLALVEKHHREHPTEPGLPWDRLGRNAGAVAGRLIE